MVCRGGSYCSWSSVSSSSSCSSSLYSCSSVGDGRYCESLLLINVYGWHVGIVSEWPAVTYIPSWVRRHKILGGGFCRMVDWSVAKMYLLPQQPQGRGLMTLARCGGGWGLQTFPGKSLSRKDDSRKDVSRKDVSRKDVSQKIIFPKNSVSLF